MKKYICINYIECNWAEETPPREFPLPGNDEDVCPNCRKAKILEVIAPVRNKGRVALYIGLACLLGATLLYFINKDNTGEAANPITNKTDVVTEHPISQTASSIPTAITVEVRENNKKTENTQSNKKPIVWSALAGSGYCDPNLDGTYYYSETDNLGHTRERKKADPKCYPPAK